VSSLGGTSGGHMDPAISVAIVTLGTLTEGSDNPARQFGPAITSRRTRDLWIFTLAPSVGALIAPLIHQAKPSRPSPASPCGGTRAPAS
jgi:glycerol uptake facilitator-like aquaporin